MTHELLHSFIIEDIKEQKLIITLTSKQNRIPQIKQVINSYQKIKQQQQKKPLPVTEEICSIFYTHSIVCF